MILSVSSFLAVEEMKRGSSPTAAAQVAISRIVKKFPKFFGAVIALNTQSEHGAACNGMDLFPYSVADEENKNIEVIFVKCQNEN